jgi:hypothetical protein
MKKLAFALCVLPTLAPAHDLTDVARYCLEQYPAAIYENQRAVCIREGRYVPPKPAAIPGYSPAQCNLILNHNGTDAQKAACMYPNDMAKRVEFMREMALTRAANPTDFTLRQR